MCIEKERYQAKGWTEALTGNLQLLQHNVEQHQAFSPGFEEFQRYVQACKPEDYDGQKTRGLVEAFAVSIKVSRLLSDKAHKCYKFSMHP